MIQKFIEVTNGPNNWGKFMVARFGTEYTYLSRIAAIPLLEGIGWDSRHIIVFDLQTCEGAAFLPGGKAKYDLEKHRIWVCPLFEPFREWLYKRQLDDVTALPDTLDLPDATSALAGYRRKGPQKVEK
jgi:hypothetical protein